MPKTLIATLASTTLLITACAAPSESPEAETSPVAESATQAPASTPSPATTPTTTPTKAVHKLGDTVDRPQGASVTAYEYRVVTDVADHRFGAIDMEVCVGNEDGSDGAYVTTDFWSAVSDDSRRYEAASTRWGNDEISPVLDYENDVGWGDCLRGWVVTDATEESNVTKIRYFNSQSEEPGDEEILWQVP